MTKPSSDQAMAGYAVATKFGVYEAKAFDLVDEMFKAFQLKSQHIVIERDEFDRPISIAIRDENGILKMIERF